MKNKAKNPTSNVSKKHINSKIKEDDFKEEVYDLIMASKYWILDDEDIGCAGRLSADAPLWLQALSSNIDLI